MNVRRSDAKHSNCDDLLTFIWSSDGWCYDIQNKTRRKFFSTDEKDVFKMFEETGNFVITDIQYQETVEFTLISQNPRTWKEGSDMFCVIDSNC
jgi:hypothetical protein